MRSIPGPGRPPSTDRTELAAIAFALFNQQGFEVTTVDDIARAAGISRRTFFRYYASKNDAVWGDFDGLLQAMERWLAETPDDRPLMET
ncbi:MAG: TetR family transcriptional regulator, partial [Acidimicrobiales bacterium]